jgi:flagellar L-ring protein precursor FlgH
MDWLMPAANGHRRSAPSALGVARPKWRHIAWVLLFVGGTRCCSAQNSSLYHSGPPAGPAGPTSLPHSSWTYVPLPPPKKIELHDVVVVRVDEIARMQSEGEVNRRKTSTYNARLADWIMLRGLEAIKPDPQSDGDQRVQGQLQQQLRATSELEARDALSLSIACEVIDIRPNGNLVLEGHKRLAVNEETWDVSLTGLCRPDDILPNNEILSRNILQLEIHKRDDGQVRDGYKRGWFQRWFDEWDPF